MQFRLKVNTAAVGHQCGATPRDVASIWRGKSCHQHQQHCAARLPLFISFLDRATTAAGDFEPG